MDSAYHFDKLSPEVCMDVCEPEPEMNDLTIDNACHVNYTSHGQGTTTGTTAVPRDSMPDVRVSLDNKHAHATPSSRPSSSRSPSLLPSQHAHFAACSHVKSASAYQPSLFGASHNTSSSRLLPPRPSSPVPRKRGRPKVGANLPKPVIYGPRPRLGRPPGTGYKQKQQVLGVGPVEPAKRSRGRPKKDVRASAVSIEFGKLFVSGSLRAGNHHAAAPPLNCETPTPTPATSPPAIPSINGCRAEAADQPSTTAIPRVPLLPASSIASHREIIPNEDPQRSVATLDDDEDSEADGGGLGHEDDDPDNNDEANDDESIGVGSSSQKRRPLPAWLVEPFRARLDESKYRDENGLPLLYSKHGTFWFPKKSTFFILTQRRFAPPDLYNPQFFLWDPEPLCNRIPCPNCQRPLQRHGELSRPRRCVDLDSTFWIIGYRYRCHSCVHPKSGKKTVTFRSWDPRILAVLPPALAAEFPARLTHRSGISNTLFLWIRSCFQNGLGSKQVSDAIRVQHLLAHDQLHLQYLQHLALRKLDAWTGEKYEAFLPFDDFSPRGRHGFIPSSQYVRDMYDSDIENHRNDFNQHTAMLTAEICAIDHSHKVTKHIARVDGEQVFTGLLTVTNEKGEIRSCNLVATKSHSQFELALDRMRESLNLYGHCQPTVFYTDNMADKQFLEHSFPSLRDNMVPIEKYGHLDAFKIPYPPEVEIIPKDTVHSINDTARLILDDVPQDEGFLVVGFDSEWNVEISAHGNVQNRGKTAVIQIAYQNRVYVLQISEMLAKGELPHQLKLLLSHPRILKVGRLIDSDLGYLQNACHSSIAFVGGLDLAKYAKDRCVITNISKTSLSDLCALILHKRLDKNVPERISQAWEDRILTEEQLWYAAKDAYVSLRIYEELTKIDVPRPLPASFHPSLPVFLYSTDNTTVIAEGQISPHLNNRIYNGVNITPTRTVIDISKVLVPGAIITTHGRRSLDSFGTTPFSVVCLRSHLRTFSPNTAFQTSLESNSSPSFIEPVSESLTVNQDLEALADESNIIDSEVISFGSLLTQDLSGPSEQLSRDIDPESVALGDEILGSNPDIWDNIIHSRVLKDIWHVFHMFYISATHGLRKQFTRELRDTIFIPDITDKARINAWGATQVPPSTYESLRNSSPNWLRERCKHIIPSPHILYPLVANVFCTYGPIVDPDSTKPLFSPDNWKTAKNILDLIKKGFVSDPPGIPLYTVMGLDKKAGGLPIYRCARGTNATEGGVHTHIRSRLPKFGASIRHVHAALMDFTLRHNLLTGTYNSTGQRYQGHFSIWVTNHIQELLISLEDMLIDPIHVSGWVNGNLYTPTNEVIGILPIPDDIRSLSAMAPYIAELDYDQKHRFLAEMQGTRKPVLPVHTSYEKQVFRQLMNSDPVFSPKSGEPRWRDAVKIWNSHADRTDNISYKLIEQLKVYYAKWKTLSHIKETLSLSAELWRPLSITIHDPRRSIIAPAVPEHALRPHVVQKGLLGMPAHSLETSSMSISLPSHTDPETSMDQAPRCSNGNEPAALTRTLDPNTLSNAAGPSCDNRVQIEYLARERVATAMAKAKPIAVSRKRRTCRKCARLGCSGSQRVENCTNPCRDCGVLRCRGRNPKRLNKICSEGWD